LLQTKSTKDLLEEAKKIAKPGGEPMWKLQGKKSPRKKDAKKDSKKDKKAQGKIHIKSIYNVRWKILDVGQNHIFLF
jgi:hypothetical protein